MKLKTGINPATGKPIYETVNWGDHAPTCAKCMKVDLAKTATFTNACGMGAALLAEKARQSQAPVAKERAKEVRKWAREAGVFKNA